MQAMLVYPKEKTLFAILATLGVLAWLLIVLGTRGTALLYVLMFFIFYLFAQSGLISYIKGTAVKITPQQFGMLHDRIQHCAAKLGMDKLPDAYLLRSDGLFNAFATKFLGRNYIALYAELVEALLDKPEALNFYIGHELGHLQRKHLNYAPLLAPVAWLPLIGPAYARAREYTCDRHGLACCASPDDALHAVAVLAAGGKHAKVIDLDAYAGQRQASGGFWMSFHELVGDYPWLVKRLHAVRELGKGREPAMPARHPLGWLFALFVPRTGMPAGGGLLVIIAMIGILAAVAIPQYSAYQNRGKSAAFVSEGRQLMTRLQAHSGSVDEARAVIDALRHNDSKPVLSLSTSNMSVAENGQITLEAKQASLAGASFSFMPTVQQDGAVSWSCELSEAGKLDAKDLAWCS